MDTDTAWELWARQDPYYGVLTDSRYRMAVMTPESKGEFLRSGQQQIAHLLDICQRFFDFPAQSRRALDFGCGVGRTLIPLAAIACRVVGADVAPSMLAEARRNCVECGVSNASFVLSDDTLTSIEGTFDLIHSSMVFQHIEAERGRRLFARLLDHLQPSGFGVIHVTFGLNLHADNFGLPGPPPAPSRLGVLSNMRAAVRRWRDGGSSAQASPAVPTADNDLDPEMQMHWYHMSELMFALHAAGVANVYSEFTDHGGAIGAVLYFQRGS